MILFHLALAAATVVSLGALARSADGSRAGFGLASLGFAGLGALLVALVGMVGGGFLGIQGLAWLTFAYGPAWLAGAAMLCRRASPAGALALGTLALSTLAVGGWAFFVEPQRLEVGIYRVDSPKVTAPLRIAVLADLQTDRVGDFERRVLDTVDSLDADLVLLAGDYFQVATEEAWRRLAAALRPLLGTLDAPLGAWAVSGDTEPPEWRELFAGTVVRPLSTGETLDLGPMLLTGWDAATARSREDLARDDLAIEPANGRFHVLLAHPPDAALRRPPVDLIVAGHVHGGQVRLPAVGPLLTLSRVPRDWAVGRTALPWGGDLIVSRGVGMERGDAPRLRFLCRPEIVLIEVRPGEAALRR